MTRGSWRIAVALLVVASTMVLCGSVALGWTNQNPTPSSTKEVEVVEPLVLVVVPTGLGGDESFLDAGDPGTYGVGDVVTGRFNLYDGDGEELRMGYVHVYVYSVDSSGLRDKLTLLTHEVFHFDREAGEYIFSWDTTGQAPGEYVIRLSFGDDAGTTYDLRIRVT